MDELHAPTNEDYYFVQTPSRSIADEVKSLEYVRQQIANLNTATDGQKIRTLQSEQLGNCLRLIKLQKQKLIEFSPIVRTICEASAGTYSLESVRRAQSIIRETLKLEVLDTVTDASLQEEKKEVHQIYTALQQQFETAVDQGKFQDSVDIKVTRAVDEAKALFNLKNRIIKIHQNFHIIADVAKLNQYIVELGNISKTGTIPVDIKNLADETIDLIRERVATLKKQGSTLGNLPSINSPPQAQQVQPITTVPARNDSQEPFTVDFSSVSTEQKDTEDKKRFEARSSSEPFTQSLQSFSSELEYLIQSNQLKDKPDDPDQQSNIPEQAIQRQGNKNVWILQGPHVLPLVIGTLQKVADSNNLQFNGRTILDVFSEHELAHFNSVRESGGSPVLVLVLSVRDGRLLVGMEVQPTSYGQDEDSADQITKRLQEGLSTKHVNETLQALGWSMHILIGYIVNQANIALAPNIPSSEDIDLVNQLEQVVIHDLNDMNKENQSNYNILDSPLSALPWLALQEYKKEAVRLKNLPVEQKIKNLDKAEFLVGLADAITGVSWLELRFKDVAHAERMLKHFFSSEALQSDPQIRSLIRLAIGSELYWLHDADLAAQRKRGVASRLEKNTQLMRFVSALHTGETLKDYSVSVLIHEMGEFHVARDFPEYQELQYVQNLIPEWFSYTGRDMVTVASDGAVLPTVAWTNAIALREQTRHLDQGATTDSELSFSMYSTAEAMKYGVVELNDANFDYIPIVAQEGAIAVTTRFTRRYANAKVHGKPRVELPVTESNLAWQLLRLSYAYVPESYQETLGTPARGKFSREDWTNLFDYDHASLDDAVHSAVTLYDQAENINPFGLGVTGGTVYLRNKGIQTEVMPGLLSKSVKQRMIAQLDDESRKFLDRFSVAQYFSMLRKHLGITLFESAANLNERKFDHLDGTPSDSIVLYLLDDLTNTPDQLSFTGELEIQKIQKLLDLDQTEIVSRVLDQLEPLLKKNSQGIITTREKLRFIALVNLVEQSVDLSACPEHLKSAFSYRKSESERFKNGEKSRHYQSSESYLKAEVFSSAIPKAIEHHIQDASFESWVFLQMVELCAHLKQINRTDLSESVMKIIQTGTFTREEILHLLKKCTDTGIIHTTLDRLEFGLHFRIRNTIDSEIPFRDFLNTSEVTLQQLAMAKQKAEESLAKAKEYFGAYTCTLEFAHSIATYPVPENHEFLREMRVQNLEHLISIMAQLIDVSKQYLIN